jgi:antibiotic biosynthesis monooxygenase (ABM) superfamily enzyme
MGRDAAITVYITRKVRPGLEAEFERALHAFVQRSLRLPGQHGVHISRPAPGTESREYGIVRKFANRDALEEFRSSAEYLEWNLTAAEMTEGEGRTEELCGLESWFTPTGAPLRPLPRWKQATATFLGVYPVATLLGLSLGPWIAKWPLLLRNAVFNVCVVALLTWVVMPLITRLLHGWLHKSK